MADEAKTQNWWSTFPGLLTAVAGVLTAATGLVAAVKQTGIIDRPAPPVTQSGAATPGESSAGKATPVPTNDSALPSARQQDFAAYTGIWHDSGEWPRGPLRMALRQEGGKLYVHVWARCHPQACDWGEVAAELLTPGTPQPAFKAQFTAAERETSMEVHAVNADTLELKYSSKFTNGAPEFSGTRVFKRPG